MLRIYHELPAGLMECQPQDLERILGAPSLIYLSGRREPPLFVSLLQHGNEDTGFWAVIKLLQRYQNRELPRSLVLFIGNVKAATEGVRRLENQPDYNRMWPGGENSDCREAQMMADVTERMRRLQIFASVDLHNNTGINPHYACVNALDSGTLHLAALFSRTVLYFLHPTGVQSLAFSQFCPAITVECGQVGSQYGVDHAFEFLDAALHIDQLPQHSLRETDIELFHTVAQVNVSDSVSFSFKDDRDLLFDANLDRFNFRELPAGTSLGTVKNSVKQPLLVWDESDTEVSGRYFRYDQGQIQLRRPVMFSMLTLDERIIRQDCLGYLMERYPLSLCRK